MVEIQFSKRLVQAGEAHNRAGENQWERAELLYEEFLDVTRVKKPNTRRGKIPNHLKGTTQTRHNIYEDMHNDLLRNGFAIPKSTVETDIRMMERLYANRKMQRFINNVDFACTKMIILTSLLSEAEKFTYLKDIELGRYASPKTNVAKTLKDIKKSKKKVAPKGIKAKGFKRHLFYAVRRYVNALKASYCDIAFTVYDEDEEIVDEYENRIEA